MYGCERWTIKKAECWKTEAFELWCWRSLLRVPWTCKEIQPVPPKGNQSWVFIGRTDADAEAPILWPPDGKSWLIGKDPDAGKDWGQEEKGTMEDETVGWHHRLDRQESEQTLGGSAGQCCGSWGCKESTWLRNWTTVPHQLKTSPSPSSLFLGAKGLRKSADTVWRMQTVDTSEQSSTVVRCLVSGVWHSEAQIPV